MNRRFRPFAPLLALCLAAGAMAARQPGELPAAVTDPELARADYVENCGGCHGVQGRSAPAELPELRDRVGWFLCTPGSRAYLLRLPNVAHSRITDNQQLADLMNFVVFGLGGASAPASAVPFTAEEVARERKLALTAASLRQERAHYVDSAIRACRAPATLRQFYPGENERKRVFSGG
ncbi:MAG TPA: cytochrome C [Sphingobium sp.]|uniref:c-type cytochrome n=1 Tax=Sphingobium sp. TaxID=1912891 RepID=UPI002ED0D934